VVVFLHASIGRRMKEPGTSKLHGDRSRWVVALSGALVESPAQAL